MAGIGDTLNKPVAGLPLWGWAIAAVGGVLVGWYFLKKQGTSSSTTTSTPSTDSQSFSDNPPAGTTGTGTGTVSPDLAATIRAKMTSGPASTYDATAAGIPVRASPGIQSQAGLIPYNASVELTGPPVGGPDNFGQPGTGSTLWYPVSYNGVVGYISAFDIATITGQWTGSTSATITPATAHLG